MNKYQKINTLFGWIAFLVSAIVYTLTIESSASFWDCGEFITTAYKLEVGHPPGAPFFMIVGRIFTLLAFGDVTKVPVMINMMSALASAFTIMFLFWTITHIARKIILPDNNYTPSKMISIIGAGIVGALAYTFSDTFWFSAVEGEVYAFSSLFTAVVFWAILKWENIAHQKYADRWLILIFYLMGLSIGVHLLNLLAIPAITFVYYFKKYNPTRKGIIYTSIISVGLLAGIMYGIIQGFVVFAGKFELLFVNSFGLPYNTGVIFYIVVLLGLLLYGIYYTYTNKKVMVNTLLTGVLVILIGYSSFSMILLRSIADPPMNQNRPNNVFALLSYLNREQYGDRPLVFGQYFNAPVVDYDEGSSVYTKKDGKYVEIDKKIERKFDEKYITFFPRMYSDQSAPNHVQGYKMWANLSSDDKEKPSFKDNLAFFFKYQIGHMYMRYFMWNFAGRQNDIQNVDGNVRDGNWISGIPFIDNSRLGNQDTLPDHMKNNKARNSYFFLPLILGILGLLYLYKHNKKDLLVVFLLFFFTGVAIVIYLNQPPYQPRERDYAYAGSFYAYAVFIGFGVLSIIDLLKKYASSVLTVSAIVLLSILLVPGIMAMQNWDDHDRSGRYIARDFASNYLNSCDKDAIIFTNGDNDTFPLWYAQEVEGIRTDVRVINLSYLNTDWYINQMRKKAYLSNPVPFSLGADKIQQGTRDAVYIQERIKRPVNLKEIMNFVGSDDLKTRLQTNQEFIDFIPTRSFYIPVDSAKVVANGTVAEKSADQIQTTLNGSFSENKNYVRKNELMVLDLLANFNWDRPIYYAVTVGPSNYVNLQKYFQLDGLAYRIVPIESESQPGNMGRIDTDILYENMMNKFKWGGINNPDVYLDENVLRMLMNLKNNFSRLAKKLIEEGKKEKAIAVLDKCVELMPNEIVPYNFYNVLIGEAYYLADAFDKGDDIFKIVSNNIMQDFNYYLSLDHGKLAKLSNDMNRSYAILHEIIRQEKLYNRTEMAQQLETDLNNLMSLKSEALQR